MSLLHFSSVKNHLTSSKRYWRTVNSLTVNKSSKSGSCGLFSLSLSLFTLLCRRNRKRKMEKNTFIHFSLLPSSLFVLFAVIFPFFLSILLSSLLSLAYDSPVHATPARIEKHCRPVCRLQKVICHLNVK